jgi:hypothetical protein
MRKYLLQLGIVGSLLGSNVASAQSNIQDWAVKKAEIVEAVMAHPDTTVIKADGVLYTSDRRELSVTDDSEDCELRIAVDQFGEFDVYKKCDFNGRLEKMNYRDPNLVEDTHSLTSRLGQEQTDATLEKLASCMKSNGEKEGNNYSLNVSADRTNDLGEQLTKSYTVILTEDPGSKDLLTIADKRYFLNGMPTRVANKMRDLGLTGYRAVPKTGKNRDYHKGFEGLSVQEVRAFELKVAKKILGEHCK